MPGDDAREAMEHAGLSGGVEVESDAVGHWRKVRRPQRHEPAAGIPADQLNPGSTESPPEYAVAGLYEFCRRRFAPYPNIHVVQGRVPEVLRERAPEQVAFLHLDMNSASAELAALEFFWGRMAPGALILLDDYGWRGYRAQKLAEDPFFAARGRTVLELPTGQGVVLV